MAGIPPPYRDIPWKISGNPPVFSGFSFSEINNFASCLGVAEVAEVDKENGYWLRSVALLLG
jgi:hypothetical protein